MSRTPRRFLPRAIAAVLVLSGLSSAAAQQGLDGSRPGTTGDHGLPGIFKVPGPPSPGGTGYIPPDAGPGGTGGGGGPSGGGGKDDGGTSGGGLAGVRGTSVRAVSGGTALPQRTQGTTGPAQTGTVGGGSDAWDVWWERNKFDFIRLRRVEDTRDQGQGQRAETPEEREQRLAAVRATLREHILPELRALAASDDARVRGAAAVSLGKLRDAASLDLLAQLLQDPDEGVRRAAMLALGITESGRGAYLLMNIADGTRAGESLLGATHVTVEDRGIALVAAALRGVRTSEPVVMQQLQERSALHPELVALACEAAGLMQSSRAVRELIELAFEDELPEYVRSAAVTALGRIGDPSAVPAVVQLLDGDLDPRRAAAVALGYLAHAGETTVVDRLGRTLLEETDAPTRHFAAVTLGRIGGEGARAALLAGFAAARDDMRPWLALGLGLCERREPTADGARRLVALAGAEANSQSYGAYLVALGLSRSAEALGVLTDAVVRAHRENAGYAAMALGLSGQPAARAVLRDLLASASSPDVLRQAALGLGILGDTASIPSLVELIRTTSNPFVASYAAIGIAFMGDETAAGSLLHLIDSEGPRGVRTTYAVAAVGQLFDTDRRPALSRLAAGDNYLSAPNSVERLLALGF